MSGTMMQDSAVGSQEKKDRRAPPFRLLHPAPEAAALLGVCLRTLYNLPELKPVYVGRRRLYRRADLESFARRSHRTVAGGNGGGEGEAA